MQHSKELLDVASTGLKEATLQEANEHLLELLERLGEHLLVFIERLEAPSRLTKRARRFIN